MLEVLREPRAGVAEGRVVADGVALLGDVLVFVFGEAPSLRWELLLRRRLRNCWLFIFGEGVPG